MKLDELYKDTQRAIIDRIEEAYKANEIAPVWDGTHYTFYVDGIKIYLFTSKAFYISWKDSFVADVYNNAKYAKLYDSIMKLAQDRHLDDQIKDAESHLAELKAKKVG